MRTEEEIKNKIKQYEDEPMYTATYYQIVRDKIILLKWVLREIN